MKRLYFLLIITVYLFWQSPAAFCEHQIVADSLMSLIKYKKTPEDSLKLYYDVFDASEINHKAEVGFKILDLARRTDNQEALLDFIPQVTNLVVSDTVRMKEMLQYTDYLKDPQTQRTVRLFVNIKRAGEEASYIPETELSNALLKYAKENSSGDNDDFYEELEDLWRILIFLGNRNQGNLYLEYLTNLEEMMAQVPPKFAYLLSQFYTTSANVHTRNGNHAKAIEMDRKLLEIIDHLQQRYKDMGRTYRDYSRNYYICYRRMLNNYKALSLEEVNDLYAKCVALAEKNPDVARDFYVKENPTIYKMMAEQDYRGVVPKLKKSLANERSNSMRGRLLRLLVEAADSIHDDTTLLSALKDYSKFLKTTLDARSEEAYQELQIRYDMNQLKTDRDKLESEKRDAEKATSQRVIAVALIGLLVLALVLMFLYRSNFSLKRRIRTTVEENAHLHHTIEEMLGSTGLKNTVNIREDMKNGKGKDEQGKQ